MASALEPRSDRVGRAAEIDVLRAALAQAPAGHHPRRGEHLRASVRMGYSCVDALDPTSPIRWER